MNPSERAAVLEHLSTQRKKTQSAFESHQATYDAACAEAQESLRGIGRCRDLLAGFDDLAARLIADDGGPRLEIATRDEKLLAWADRLAAAYRPRDSEPSMPADATFGRGPESWLAVASLLEGIDDTALLTEDELRTVYFGGNPPVGFGQTSTIVVHAWTRVLEAADAIVREERSA